MLRKILIMLAIAVVGVYLVIAFVFLNKEPQGKVCKDLEINIVDSASAGFINSSEIVAELKQKKLYPKGKKMDSILCKNIEAALEKNSLIEKAECYKTPSQKVCIKISQRIPVIRIISANGDDYYIDNSGKIMKNVPCAAHLPVATGDITPEFAKKYLVSFAKFLQKDEFWNDQVEQINVTPSHELELVPRVGDHIIFLGKPILIGQKLTRLKTFYEKGLNVVGWNRYSRISLEFNNQVICTKK